VHELLDKAEGNPFFLVAGTLGAAYALAGRITEALLLLEQAIAQADVMHYMIDYTLRVAWLGEAYLLADRLDEATPRARCAWVCAQAHQGRGHEAYALHLLGDIAAQRQPPEAELAEAFYRQALALAEELGMRPLQAHCHRALGTLHKALEHREQARDSLSTAIALYRAIAMPFWLPQTEAALAQAEGDSAPQAE
jgi:tetratricopeptide (TPR) repeat protein